MNRIHHVFLLGSLQGVVGMRVGGVRRVAVRPERGWKKQDPKCATEIDMGVMSGVPGAALAKVSQGDTWDGSGAPIFCFDAPHVGYLRFLSTNG